MSMSNSMYSYRPCCGDHYHVTGAGEDLIGGRFETEAEAQNAANLLNMGATLDSALIGTDAPRAPSPHRQDVEGLALCYVEMLTVGRQLSKLDVRMISHVTAALRWCFDEPEPNVLVDFANWKRVVEYVESQGYSLVPAQTYTATTTEPMRHREAESAVVRHLSAGGSFLDAVRMYRNLTGESLAVSKAAVERIKSFPAMVEPEPVAPAWQPIETAPKDGTVILVGHPNGSVAVVSWSVHQRPEGWTEGWDCTIEWPTHWMPLPVAPREEKP